MNKEETIFAMCPTCNERLSEWFIRNNFMWCLHCQQITRWHNHQEYRDYKFADQVFIGK